MPSNNIDEMKTKILVAVLILNTGAWAQDSFSKSKPLTISGYVEGYYSYDLNKPESNTHQGFLYNYNQHNEFNVNPGMIKAAYTNERVRANLALGAGTYMNTNYTSEPATLRNIYEANLGVKLTRQKYFWFDIGIMPSHIGFESAFGKDNWALTRSLVAENTPYFESGAKLNYTTNDGKLLLSALALNGWQRITRVEGNSLMSWGTQVYFEPTDKVTLNYSTIIGSYEPDSARLWRYHHNIYCIFQFIPKLGFVANIDIGIEQAAKGSSSMNTWYTPVGILRITPTDKWAFAFRGEYFSDKNGMIIATGAPNGFKTFSDSCNTDNWPKNFVVMRLEGRYFKSKDPLFIRDDFASDKNTAITFSTAISF
jgi:hypothetical protein